MKKILIAIIELVLLSASLFAAQAEKNEDSFAINKVNCLEKIYVIPPDRHNFLGSRGTQKYDYERLLPDAERGEQYVVAWGFKGKKLNEVLVLRFEYVYTNMKDEIKKDEFVYNQIKSGSYSWTFKNIGADFSQNGKIDRWKVSLLLNNLVVAEKRSATWRALEGT